MKKLLVSFIICLIGIGIFSTNLIFAESNEVSVYLNGKEIQFDVKPQTINGRTMVPIRSIFETMGASVLWDDATQTAISTKEDTTIKMTIDSKIMYINNQAISMDVSPIVINGRTLAPARYVAEGFGADVQWSAKNKMVILTTNGLPVYEDFYNVPDLGKIFGVELERIIESKEYNGLYVYVYSYDKIDAAFTAQPMVAEKFDYALSEYGYKQITQHKNAYYSSAYLYGNPDNLDYVIRIVWRVLDGEKEVSIVEIEPTQGMYKNDGSKLTVPISEVQLWENDGWKIDGNVIMYAMDGRTICVKESEVQAYKNVGWYETLEETQQTLYAPDGRTITVLKSEVAAYKNVGWYETKAQAQAVNKKNNNMSNSNNPTADGFYYRTPTGKRYHLDPNCGGKNSYRTTNISGLSPCAKCAR